MDGLYDFIFYRVGNEPQAASDVTQATFERALEKLGDFDPERGSMVTWLRITSRNLIRDHLRRARRNVPLEKLWARIDSVLERQFAEIDEKELPGAALERLLGICFWREGLKAVFGLDRSEGGRKGDDFSRRDGGPTGQFPNQLTKCRHAFSSPFMSRLRHHIK
ncbi:hypothetical protein N9Z85_03535 [Akkermansiaceae bacterium]|nr:hypothetical protein [Akkermansiaceae bacterium]MDB4518422.1 hypothetical protein [Akkermansiaceae bacterium]